VARTAQEAIDTSEPISVMAVNLVKDTARAAISGARDVGAEAGSAAVAAVRGSIAAARKIAGDLGRLSGRVLNGTVDAAWEIGKDLMELGARGAKRPVQRQQANAGAGRASALDETIRIILASQWRKRNAVRSPARIDWRKLLTSQETTAE